MTPVTQVRDIWPLYPDFNMSDNPACLVTGNGFWINESHMTGSIGSIQNLVCEPILRRAELGWPLFIPAGLAYTGTISIQINWAHRKGHAQESKMELHQSDKESWRWLKPFNSAMVCHIIISSLLPQGSQCPMKVVIYTCHRSLSSSSGQILINLCCLSYVGLLLV